MKASEIRRGMIACSEILKPKAYKSFIADLLILSHPTKIAKGYEPVAHIDTIAEAVILEPLGKEYLKAGDKGRVNIKKALLKADKDEKQLFEVARAILRRSFGNITERRGKGVYQDIPFSIVWWQMYYAKEFEKSTSISYKKIIKFFVKNKDAYNNFIIEGKKLTIIFDKNVRDGLFMYLIDKNVKTKDFKKIVQTIGIESAWRSLGSLSVEENKKIIESLV
jgi:hypothetical protein